MSRNAIRKASEQASHSQSDNEKAAKANEETAKARLLPKARTVPRGILICKSRDAILFVHSPIPGDGTLEYAQRDEHQPRAVTEAKGAVHDLKMRVDGVW